MTDIVMVQWLDSGMQISDQWESTEKYLAKAGLNRMSVITVGMLMHEDEDQVLVGLSYDPAHDAWFGAQVIAKANIISMEVIG